MLEDSDLELVLAQGNENESKTSPIPDLGELKLSIERIMKIEHSLSGLEELLVLSNPDSRRHLEILKAKGGDVLKYLLKKFAHHYFADPAWGEEAPLKASEGEQTSDFYGPIAPPTTPAMETTTRTKEKAHTSEPSKARQSTDLSWLLETPYKFLSETGKCLLVNAAL